MYKYLPLEIMDAPIKFGCIAVEQIEKNEIEDQFEYKGSLWLPRPPLTASDIQQLLRLSGRSITLKIERSSSTDAGRIICNVNQNLRWTQNAWCILMDIFYGIDEVEPDDGNEQHSVAELYLSSQQESRQTKLMQRYATTQLYAALWAAHVPTFHKLDTIPIQLPQCFHATLRNYQKRTVRWMLQRELQSTFVPSFYTKRLQSRLAPLQGETSSEAHIYQHHYCKRLLYQSDTLPSPIQLPPGGILAEEMGLGKTVELLAVILLHPRPPGFIDSELQSKITTLSVKITEKDEDEVPLKKRRRSKNDELFCCCSSRSASKSELLMRCTRCSLLQHTACVVSSSVHTESSNPDNSTYICPNCWYEVMEQLAKPLPTRATFIVSPVAIKSQWKSEIERHVEPSHLQVLLYGGIGSGWINPQELANYDVVLCDYNTLRNEFYYTNAYTSDRKMRSKPRFMRLHSPLLMLEWWRVCLDEAQMVESNTSLVAEMVRLLPAVNRWAVTGTPIQKSIDDLCALLRFIGFDAPLEPMEIWKRIVWDFLNMNMQQQQELTNKNADLIDWILRHFMWRTCKYQVIDELNIPPQSEILHTIQLSDVERLYYTEEHANCALNFKACINKYVARGNEEGILTISPQIMKLILQPLLKIRQCCNMPVVSELRYKNHGYANIMHKHFLQPKELLAYLKSTNEIDCKTQLRTMASSYNGMASIAFLQKKFDKAIFFYDLVLKLAREYKDTPYRVDSLLQIHALHNTRNSSSSDVLHEIDIQITLLENLPIFCKKLNKYWIEIEYMVKVFDEIDMCKMRMELSAGDESDSETGAGNIKWRVEEYELDTVFIEQSGKLHCAQEQFRMKLARLKYINHLEGNAEIGICPICHTDDNERNVVLECGHCICLPCLREMQKYNRQQIITCAICRNIQSSKKVYYVTRTTDSDIDANEGDDQTPIVIKGKYSSKIKCIVQLILRLLRNYDKDHVQDEPKILIFSQWQPVLSYLAKALENNEISYRARWCSQSITDFKDPILGVSCLLMTIANGSKGLNLIEANHVFLIEPILNPGEELQAIGRVHRFGQTKTTTVHRFITRDTIEENVHNLVTAGQTKQVNWEFENTSLDDLKNIFRLKSDFLDEDDHEISNPEDVEEIEED